MVFIKVRSCSTRPAFPPVAPPLLSPLTLLFPCPLFLVLFFSSSFSPLLILRFVRRGGEGVGETVEAPLANERQNEKVRFFDVINLGMAVTRSHGRGFVAYQNR